MLFAPRRRGRCGGGGALPPCAAAQPCAAGLPLSCFEVRCGLLATCRLCRAASPPCALCHLRASRQRLLVHGISPSTAWHCRAGSRAWGRGVVRRAPARLCGAPLPIPPPPAMEKFRQTWEEVCGLVIRPQRCEYEIQYLGPKVFRVDDGVYERTDVEIVNPRGMVLKGSHFEPTPGQRPKKEMPCVVYLHGNCGSRQDALDCVTVLLPQGITLFTFDFSGSGMSDGEYVSLGFYEKQDLVSVIDHLHETGGVSRIGLWGRSMGAVTSIMYSSRDSAIGAICCDSPYSDLSELMQELVRGRKPWIPKWVLNIAIHSMRSSILNKALFDIYDLSTVKYAEKCDVPCLLGHAYEDLLVPHEHAKKIKERYQGEIQLMSFDGGHNSDRPDFFLDAVVNHFVHHLITKPAPVRPKKVFPAGAAQDDAPSAASASSASPSPREAPMHVDPTEGVDDAQVVEEEKLPPPEDAAPTSDPTPEHLQPPAPLEYPEPQGENTSAPEVSQDEGASAPEASQHEGVSAPEASQDEGASAPEASQDEGASAPEASQDEGASSQ
eukprot:TRINITY_DN582_c0_g4_i3.p1 TRINITY_DN582_c0_g4~~TRINITY_DN582_c0_g4_i3.p1  ORF type:complete len:551 (+),score=94.61 TRINITY_DN582_c0_g4_i3:499-2151(+)